MIVNFKRELPIHDAIQTLSLMLLLVKHMIMLYIFLTIKTNTALTCNKKQLLILSKKMFLAIRGEY